MDTPSGRRTVKYEEYIACSYAYLIVSRVPGLEFEPRMYVGPDAAGHFLKTLKRDLDKLIMPVIEKDEEMIFDEAAARAFETATEC